MFLLASWPAFYTCGNILNTIIIIAVWAPLTVLTHEQSGAAITLRKKRSSRNFDRFFVDSTLRIVMFEIIQTALVTALGDA